MTVHSTAAAPTADFASGNWPRLGALAVAAVGLPVNHLFGCGLAMLAAVLPPPTAVVVAVHIERRLPLCTQKLGSPRANHVLERFIAVETAQSA